MITGKTLIDWGYKPGKWFANAIQAVERARLDGASEERLRAIVDGFLPAAPVKPRDAGELGYRVNLEPEDEEERANLAGVGAHMAELMRVPTIVAGAVMPDACPSGHVPGTIPVGGVVAAG